jgi:hypothetical protein
VVSGRKEKITWKDYHEAGGKSACKNMVEDGGAVAAMPPDDGG